jgi:hypothetical protein
MIGFSSGDPPSGQLPTWRYPLAFAKSPNGAGRQNSAKIAAPVVSTRYKPNGSEGDMLILMPSPEPRKELMLNTAAEITATVPISR